MRRIISLVLMAVIVVGLSASGLTSYFTYYNQATTIANVTKYYHYDEFNKDVKVEVFTRVNKDKDAPVFAISELVNKSIEYKKLHPEATEMTIDGAFYRIEPDTACYYKRGSRYYGKMTHLNNKDYTANGECERVLYSFVKAAMNGIYVKLIWQIPNDINNKPVIDYFNQFLDKSCTFDPSRKIGEFLDAKPVCWENTNFTQLHQKVVLVSNYIDYDGKEYEGAVYSATSNIDYYENLNLPIYYKDWAHSGCLISNHPYIFGANKKYFDICFKHYDDRYEIANEVLELHNKGDYLEGGLNYKDEHLECYFTPQTQEGSADMYDAENNPLVRNVERLHSSSGQIEMYVNMYYTIKNAFTRRLTKRIYEAFKNNTNINNAFGYVDNNIINKDPNDSIYQMFREIGDVTIHKMTHAKDSIFHFGDADDYVVITGSANWDIMDFMGQQNVVFVFKEHGEDHDIYDCFKKNYQRTINAANTR